MVDDHLINEVVPSSVSMEENDLLCSIPFVDEIKEMVFTLDADSAPGPDGVLLEMLVSYWG